MVHKKATNKELLYSSTVDYLFASMATSNYKTASSLSAQKIELSNMTGTTAQDLSLPLCAYMFTTNPTGENIIWSSEGDENKIAAQTKSGPKRVGTEEKEYEIWPAKSNVEKNKTWEITCTIPADSRLHIQDQIYIEDRHGETIGQTFIVSGEGNRTMLSIKPNTDYTPGETYTLYIKSIGGENGEVLQQFVKMDFTIGQGSGEDSHVKSPKNNKYL